MTSIDLTQDRCTEAADLLAALAHPVRLQIVCGLLDAGCCVSPMVDRLRLPQALVSRHLAILREAGVVRSRAIGRRREYHVSHPAVAPLVRTLSQTLLSKEHS